MKANERKEFGSFDASPILYSTIGIIVLAVIVGVMVSSSVKGGVELSGSANSTYYGLTGTSVMSYGSLSSMITGILLTGVFCFIVLFMPNHIKRFVYGVFTLSGVGIGVIILTFVGPIVRWVLRMLASLFTSVGSAALSLSWQQVAGAVGFILLAYYVGCKMEKTYDRILSKALENKTDG
jgi:hypothetical protein